MIIAGKRCPRCGGRLETFERYVRDPHSPDGWSYATFNMPVRTPYPISPDDRRVRTPIETGSHKGEMLTEYEHVWAGWCKPCGMAFTDRELAALPSEGPASALPAGVAGQGAPGAAYPQEHGRNPAAPDAARANKS